MDGLVKAIESSGWVFDEVVVGVGSDGDKSIPQKLKAKFGEKVKSFIFEWKNDFAYARQFVMDKSTGELIAWMDTDDVWVNPKNIRGVCDDVFSKEQLGAILCNYNYDQDEHGMNKLDLIRERIVRKVLTFGRVAYTKS